MTRWQPNARGRLVQAALELYGERGYEQTTVAEIAARAGLTERTFFRYFADKREVLFSGSDELRALLVEAVEAAPRSAAPLEIVAAALETAGASIQDRTGHERASQRQALITTHAELRERELIKLASLAATIGEALRRRGVEDATASLAAEAGIGAFKVAFQRWVDDRRRRELRYHIRAAIEELKTLASRATSGSRLRRSAR